MTYVSNGIQLKQKKNNDFFENIDFKIKKDYYEQKSGENNILIII